MADDGPAGVPATATPVAAGGAAGGDGVGEAGGGTRVAVYFVTEAEGARAEAILGPDAERFANVFEGTVDSAGMAALVESGLIVEQLPGAGPPPGPSWDPALLDTVAQLQEGAASAPLQTPPGGMAPVDAVATGDSDGFGAGDEAPGLAADSADSAGGAGSGDGGPVAEAPAGEVYRIELRGSITREQQEAFVAMGVDIAAFEPPAHYRTFLTDEQVRMVEALDHVVTVTPYAFEDKLTPELVAMVDQQSTGGPSLAGDLPGFDEEQWFDCLVHREADLAHVRDLIAATPTARVVGTSNLRVRFAAPVDLPLLGALAARPEVRQLTVFTPPALAGSGVS